MSTITLSKVSYNAGTGVLTVTGSNIIGNKIKLADIKLSNGVTSQVLTSDSLKSTSANGFTVNLTGTDTIAVNQFFNVNGSSNGNNNFSLITTSGWDGTSSTVLSPSVSVSGNNSIVVSGYTTSTTISDTATTKPFSGLSITDSNSSDKDAATISFTNANGVLIGSGLSFNKTTGIYSLAATTATTLQTELKGLVFTPTQHKSTTVSQFVNNFTLHITGNGSSLDNVTDSSTQVTVNVTPIPTIIATSYNAVSGVLTVTGSNLISNSLAVADIKLQAGSQSLLLNASHDNLSNASANGFTITLNSADQTAVNKFFTGNGSNNYTLSTTAGWDGVGSPVISGSSVLVSGYNTITVSGYTANGKIADTTTINPFANLHVTDSNSSETDSATISFTAANGMLAGMGLSTAKVTGTTASYTLTASSVSNLQSELNALVFIPTAHQKAANTVINTNFTLSVNGSTPTLGSTSNSTTDVKVTATAIPVNPSITASQYNAVTGLLSISGTHLTSAINLADIFINVGANSYPLTNASLQSGTTASSFALKLNSTEQAYVNQALSSNGVSSTGKLATSVGWDGSSSTVLSNLVINVSGYDTISLGGFNTSLASNDTSTTKPFSNVTVTDSNSAETDSATISFTAANGVLSGTGLTTNAVVNGLASYSLAASSASNLQAELRALVFTPTVHQTAVNSTVSTNFTLAVNGSIPTLNNTDNINTTTQLVVAPSISGNLTETAQYLSQNLTAFEAAANQINSITLSDTTKPTLTLTETQFLANIDALATISSPYNLTITNDTGALGLTRMSPITMRAPSGSTGAVNLDVTLTVKNTSGLHTLDLGSVTTVGTTPVEFNPNVSSPKPGDQWTFSVAATNAQGGSLGAGQIEMSPGFFGASSSSAGYAANLKIAIISVSATGTVTGLPSTVIFDTYYLLVGPGNSGGVSQAELTTAFNGNTSFKLYVQNGRVAVLNEDGTTSAASSDIASAPMTVGNYSVPVNNDGFDAKYNAILVNLPNATSPSTVEMWLQNGNSNIPYASQIVSSSETYAGFSIPQGLAIGSYDLYFTDGNGGNVSGTAAIAPIAGGAPSNWSTLPSIQAPIALVVGTVSQIEANTQTSASNTWYIIKDTVENIAAAGTGLNALLNSQSLLGAYITDGFSSNNGSSVIQITGTNNYTREIQNYTDQSINLSAYSVLAVQTLEAANTPISVQLYDNGVALGGIQNLSTDGLGNLAIALPSGITLSAGTLTAKVIAGGDIAQATSVEIGVVPASGGLPNYAASVNLWVGSVNQLPTTVSAITSNTLYVIQDSVANLETLTNSAVVTAVVKILSAEGELAYALNNNQLSYLQYELIKNANIGLPNVAPITITDSLLALEQGYQWGTDASVNVYDNVASLSQLLDSKYYASAGIYLPAALNDAFSNGRINIVDNLTNLGHLANAITTSGSNTILTALPYAFADNTTTGIGSIVVSDSGQHYLAAGTSNITALLTSLVTDFKGVSHSFQLQDSVSNLTGFTTNPTVAAFLKGYNTVVNINDSVSNLLTALTNHSLNTINSYIAGTGDSNSTATLSATDTVANLNTLLNTPNDSGLYSQLKSINVIDTAANIGSDINNFYNGNNNGTSVTHVASTITVNDSFSNVYQVLTNSSTNAYDNQLLSEISTLNLNSGETASQVSQGMALQVQASYNNNNIINLPQLILPFMSGTLTASEALSTDHNNTLVTISDTGGHQVVVELLGVADNQLSAYTQGDWYHI